MGTAWCHTGSTVAEYTDVKSSWHGVVVLDATEIHTTQLEVLSVCLSTCISLSVTYEAR